MAEDGMARPKKKTRTHHVYGDVMCERCLQTGARDLAAIRRSSKEPRKAALSFPPLDSEVLGPPEDGDDRRDADYQPRLPGEGAESSNDSDSYFEDADLWDSGSSSDDEVIPPLQPLEDEDPEADFSLFDNVELGLQLSESLLNDMEDTFAASVFRERHVPDPTLNATRALEGTHASASVFLQLMEKHGCSRACRADLLKFLHLPGLDLGSLPSTLHAFESFSESVIPRSTEYVIELDGVKVYFFDLLEVLSEAIAADPDLVSKYQSPGRTQPVLYLWQTERWQNMECLFAPEITAGAHFLPVLIFADGFQVWSMVNKSLEGIYIRLAGSKLKVLHHVVVKPLRQLESVVQLTVNGVTSKYVGGPFFFCGDHIGACLYSGVRGPAASFPSRYSLIERTQLSNITLSLPARSPGEALAAYESARQQLQGSGNKAKVEEMLRSLGLRSEQSPMWLLRSFSQDFFKNWVICFLHANLLGVIKRHLMALIRGWSHSKCDEFNSRVLAICKASRYPGISMLWAVLNTKTKSDKVSVKSLTGAEMLSNVSQAALDGWRLHLNCTYYLMRDLSADEQELVPGMIQAWQTVALAAYKADGGTDDFFAVPNFEAQRHWAAQMKWLGPPRLQSTAGWEAHHQVMKRAAKKTNRKAPEKDILGKVNVSSHLGQMIRFSGDGLEMPQARERPLPSSFGLAGTCSKSKWSSTERELAKKSYELLGIAVAAPFPKHVIRRTALKWPVAAKEFLHANDWLEAQLLVGGGEYRDRIEYLQLLGFFQFERPGARTVDSFARVSIFVVGPIVEETLGAADPESVCLRRVQSLSLMPVSLPSYKILRLVRVIHVDNTPYLSMRGCSHIGPQ